MQVETNVNLLESTIYEIVFHIWCFLFWGRKKVKHICGYEFIFPSINIIAWKVYDCTIQARKGETYEKIY